MGAKALLYFELSLPGVHRFGGGQPDEAGIGVVLTGGDIKQLAAIPPQNFGFAGTYLSFSVIEAMVRGVCLPIVAFSVLMPWPSRRWGGAAPILRACVPSEVMFSSRAL